MKKRILSFAAALVLLVVCAAGFGGSAAKAEATKPIDVYLVGGQSNAAGCSKATGVSGTFGNIMYAGEVERTLDGSGVKHFYINDFADYPTAVTVGFGIYSDRIGPEFGMAKVLDSVYSSDNKAMIFKSAAGGTSLRDARTELDMTYGNWYPRSMWAKGFTPDPSKAPTGVQYKRFVDNFRTVYGELKANGYEPRIKGMAWMQGENDLGAPDAYKVLIKAFIADIRTDIAEITGNDEDLTMPFVIGEIATTVGEYNNPLVPAFNDMQREVAKEGVCVYTVPTADLIINDANGNTANGDLYHFSGKDMVTLGERFAEKLLSSSNETVVELKTIGKNGKATYKLSDGGDKITVTIEPNDGYKASSVKVNDVESVDKLVGNVLEIETNGQKRFEITVRFAKKSALEIKTEVGEGGRASIDAETVYEGDKLVVTVVPEDGYRVKSVAFDGKELARNAETGKYELDGVTVSGTVKVEFEKESNGGCGGKNAALAIGIALAFAVFALKRG